MGIKWEELSELAKSRIVEQNPSKPKYVEMGKGLLFKEVNGGLKMMPDVKVNFKNYETNFSINNTWKASELESSVSISPLAKSKVEKAIAKRFLVRVTSRRRQLLDQDNLCEKYHVDLLRYANVIQNDSPKTTQIEVQQVKCKKGESEAIILEVFEL